MRRMVLYVLLLGGALVAGCTPRTVWISTAVFLDGDHPTAAIHSCEGHQVTMVQVSELRLASDGGLRANGFGWSTVDTAQDDPVDRVRILAVPAGWEETRSASNLLTEFQEGYSYQLDIPAKDVDGGSERGIGRGLAFTLADLRSLGEDQVWAIPSSGGKPRAFSRADFDKRDC